MTTFSVQAYIIFYKVFTIVKRAITYLIWVDEQEYFPHHKASLNFHYLLCLALSKPLRVVSDESSLPRIFTKMATGSAVLYVFSCHVRHIEAFYLKLASGLGSILNERALGKTRVTSIFWVISNMANEAGDQCKMVPLASLYSVKG